MLNNYIELRSNGTQAGKSASSSSNFYWEQLWMCIQRGHLRSINNKTCRPGKISFVVREFQIFFPSAPGGHLNLDISDSCETVLQDVWTACIPIGLRKCNKFRGGLNFVNFMPILGP